MDPPRPIKLESEWIEPATKKVKANKYWIDTIGTRIVRLEVGTGFDQVVFNVHKTILCKKIAFFDKMFNGKFLEGITHSAKMPEDNIEAFKLMLGWVYSGAIEPGIDLTFANGNSASTPLLELLILAEKYDINPLVDATMDYLIKLLQENRIIIGESLWVYTYENTRRTSKLRLFFTRTAIYAMRFKDGEFTSNPKFWTVKAIHSILSQSPEILMDYLALTQGVKLQEDPLIAPPCDYHRHAADEDCPYKPKTTAKITNESGNRPSDLDD
ncbi:uncharacterized protein Bfra_011523 [Botrytis fragariae]|uniref:BTB domain-containing protein n=1 Tax=Botrytis fragariae TaxID=1964551 RepID=A0A8H6EKN2_9HELO|nr:uncharacterized protein Bfra_011523 [Botrytis fragariae]KAF5875761.1 hypothetical protein Bfra_011523 [Botrytis fragariae]